MLYRALMVIGLHPCLCVGESAGVRPDGVSREELASGRQLRVGSGGLLLQERHVTDLLLAAVCARVAAISPQ
jgi:hypothetical protein